MAVVQFGNPTVHSTYDGTQFYVEFIKDEQAAVRWENILHRSAIGGIVLRKSISVGGSTHEIHYETTEA